MVVDGQPQDTITDVRSFEVAVQLELLREGYLGETTDRRDEIFRGIRGRMTLHVENQTFLNFMASVVNRARRREPGTQINIKATLNFPNGDRPRVQMNNVFFGEQPFVFGSRSDYGELTLEFEGSDFEFIST
jgi:hypothetical protein